MRKNTITKVVAICLAAALSVSLLGGIGSFANAATMTESVYVNKNVDIAKGVRINITTYDSAGKATTQQFIPKDVNGNTVTPFITNGTTYLPVRAVSQIFGATIDWNTFYSSVVIATPKSETKSVTNPNPKPVDTSKVTATYSTVAAVTGVNVYVDNNLYIPTDANGNKVDVIMINGTTYLPVRAMTKIFLGSDSSEQIAWDGSNYTVTISGVKGSTSGGTEDITEDSLLSKLVAGMKEKFLNLLISPLKAFNSMRDLMTKMMSGEADISDAISTMKGLMDPLKLLDLFKGIGSENGLSLSSMKDLLGVSSDSSLITKVMTSFMGSFGSSDSSSGAGPVEWAKSFYIFTRALDRLF